MKIRTHSALYGGARGDGSELDSALLDLYAEFPWWAAPIGPLQQRPSIVTEIESRNPHQKRLGYFVLGGADVTRLNPPQTGTIYGRHALLVEKFKAWLTYDNGVLDSYTNVNMAAPGLGVALAEFMANEFHATPGLVGWFLDICPYYVPVNGPDLTLNQFKVGTRKAFLAPWQNEAQLRDAWDVGTTIFATTLRALLPGAWIVHNAGNGVIPQFDGAMLENFPFQAPGGTLRQALFNMQNGVVRVPRPVIWIKTDSHTNSAVEAIRARLGLAVAHLNNDGVHVWCPGHPTLESAYWRLPEHDYELGAAGPLEFGPGYLVARHYEGVSFLVNYGAVVQNVVARGRLVKVQPQSAEIVR